MRRVPVPEAHELVRRERRRAHWRHCRVLLGIRVRQHAIACMIGASIPSLIVYSRRSILKSSQEHAVCMSYACRTRCVITSPTSVQPPCCACAERNAALCAPTNAPMPTDACSCQHTEPGPFLHRQRRNPTTTTPASGDDGLDLTKAQML